MIERPTPPIPWRGGDAPELARYRDMLLRINRKMNLIGKGTEDRFDEIHLAHVLTLATRPFPDGARVVDWGTGGGLPAVPLAICFPAVRFFAVDAVGKKIQAVRSMANRLGLNNLETWHGRAEAWSGTADYSVSRATAPLATLWGWHLRVRSEPADVGEGYWPPGLLCLKGGDLTEETALLKKSYPGVEVRVTALQEAEPHSDRFAGKYLIQVM